MDNAMSEHEREEQRAAEARHRAESLPAPTLRERARAPRNRAEMRDRYEAFG